MSSRLVCCLLLVAYYITLVSSFGVSLKSPQIVPGPYSDVQVIWFHTGDTDQNNGVLVVLLGPGNVTQSKPITPEQANSIQGEMTFRTAEAGQYLISVEGPDNTLLAAHNFTVVASAPTSPSTGTTGNQPESTTTPPGGTETTSKQGQSETSTSSPSETSSEFNTGTSSSTSETSSINTSSASQTNISGSPSSPSAVPSPPESSLPPSDESESSQNHTPVIVGAVVGFVALLVLVILAVIFIRRRKRRKRPVSFHRDMMVRSPGPSLYPGSRATSPTGDGTMVTMPSSITDLLVQAGPMAVPAPSASPSTAGSNPSHEVMGNRMSEYDGEHQLGIAYQPHQSFPSSISRPDSWSHHQKPSISSSHVDP